MKRPDREPLNRGLLISLIILLTAAAAPHFLHLHLWISLFFLASVALRVASIFYPRLQPGRLLLFLLAMAGLANVIINHPVLFSSETTIALMTSMVGLKLLEIHTRRDLFIVVFIGYFLLATQFLFNQEMYMVGLVLVLTIALTGVLLENSRQRPDNNPIRAFGSSFMLLLQALPIMLVLFIFFPRLSGPLWFIETEEKVGRTGLGDSISMGSITRLALSRSVAFRVDFTEAIPPPPQRYWRGPILWDTDGKNWTRGNPLDHPPSKLKRSGSELRYSVTMEPTDNRWLMALDLPTEVPSDAAILQDFQVMRTEPIRSRLLYDATSRLDYNTGAISTDGLKRGLQLPDNITRRMRNLVQGWRSTSDNDLGVVNRALRHFRNEEFYYTLRPPPLGDNPVDQFMFESRRGFCEHFASSFTLLMRLAGIPSRVVTGYQGGEINPLGGHLVVRQSDAHAWSEVWLSGRGWVRIDPTAAVAPERIERNFEFDANFADSPLGTPLDLTGLRLGPMARLLKQIGWGIDAINLSWHRWVLGYTQERQSMLMSILGLDFLKGHSLGLAMVGFASVIVFLLGFHLWRNSNKISDRLLADYLRFCRKLAKAGLARRPTEGPLDFLARICSWRPELTATATGITMLYVGLRYGQDDGKERRRSLHKMIDDFSP